ncbi:MAG: ABC transporter ATP-binding protein [Desulfobacteraceae bacterium]|nr:ABC transporter ATP-binding protein [Desulfobacteraceae bacterium]
MLYKINHLKKIYGERTVLDIPELVLEKGIIYSLQGPNGSGKTTLLEILALLVPPTSGELNYGNTRIDFVGDNLTYLRREIVMVQQDPVLFTTTVHKNLEFGLRVRGVSKRERGKIIRESLDLVKMHGFVDAEAHNLSGGETQRVAIAQALVCSPKVMLFDEPTSSVDVESQVDIENIIKEINSQKKISIIFTTHNLTQASRLSGRVISLFEGRLTSQRSQNLFNGRIITDGHGNRSCLIQDKINLPIKTEKTGDVKLSIDPAKVMIFPDGEPVFGENTFVGRLVQMIYEHNGVRAIADIGVPLNILLSRKEVRDNRLCVGDELRISFPSDAAEVL